MNRIFFPFMLVLFFSSCKSPERKRRKSNVPVIEAPVKKDTEKEKKYTGYKVYKRNFSSNTNPEKISSKGYTSKYTPPKIEKQYIAPKEKPAGKEKEFSKNYEVKHIKPAYLPPIPKNIKKDCSGGECKSETSNIGQFNIIN